MLTSGLAGAPRSRFTKPAARRVVARPDYLSPALVQELAPQSAPPPHRPHLRSEAEEVTPDKIIAQVVERTPVPAK